MADRVGEVAQVTGAALDRLGHRAEVAVQRLDFDGSRGRRGRHRTPTARDCPRRIAQCLDRPDEAAREQSAQNDQRREDQHDAERDLAPVLINPGEQHAGRARQQQHADHMAVGDDRVSVVDAEVRSPA